MTDIFFALGAFAIMEPVAAGTHRLVMHGRGWAWHRSHHTGRHNRLETNDLYPGLFACFTIALIAGATAFHAGSLEAVAAGICAYGLAYFAVHDICVHGRLSGGRPVVKGRWLRWVAACHRLHHRTNAAPYGFLFPVPPRGERARGATRRATSPMTAPTTAPASTSEAW